MQSQYNPAVTIYALCEPDGETVRYVGQTSQTMQARYNAHLKEAETGTTPKCLWIRQLAARGQTPVMIAIEETTQEDGSDREAAWLERYRAAGATMLNRMPIAPGGRGRRRSVVVLLPGDVADELAALAQSRGLATTELLRAWIGEQLAAARSSP